VQYDDNWVMLYWLVDKYRMTQ